MSSARPTSCLLDRLPAEIRVEIYHYAFLQPCFMTSPSDEADIIAKSEARDPGLGSRIILRRPAVYWGTESMTRLLRVCHQVHNEALPVLYARFTFCWPSYTNYRLVQTVLDPLRAVARECIRSIKLCIVLQAPRLIPHFDQWRAAFSRIAASLPSLLDVTVYLSWMDRMCIPASSVRLVVERGLNLLRPLRNVKKLKVRYRDETNIGNARSARRMAIGSELQRRIAKGQWDVNVEVEPSEPRPKSLMKPKLERSRSN